MHEIQKFAKENIEAAQDKILKSTNQHRRPITWNVGNKVYLSTKNLKTLRPSRKLAEQQTGPYKVLEKVGNLYRLRLPKGSKIYDVFALDVLIKDPNNLLPGQENPEPPADVIAGEEEQKVNKILAIRLVRKTLKYKVSQVGHNPDPKWYLALYFMGSPYKL